MARKRAQPRVTESELRQMEREATQLQPPAGASDYMARCRRLESYVVRLVAELRRERADLPLFREGQQ